MTYQLAEIPEIDGLGSNQGMIRIPPEMDVPITHRVQQLVDTAAFRRLSQISQLGLVSTVYPAANHTRFEHSLGVYRTGLRFLQQLARDPRFSEAISPKQAELFIAASLLHDIGHWPFCHPLEDMRDPRVPRHEALAADAMGGEVGQILVQDWGIQPNEISSLLNGENASPAHRLLSSLLSGPIDVDKMDYLQRDSLHAGVPYGQNFDRPRLIGSLCVNKSGDGLAITDKGRTAAEMMVFARYVMFSEVYWHHAVRSATAMLQRAFYLLIDAFDMPSLFSHTEASMIQDLQQAGRGTPAQGLLHGLFGPRRQLYKRLTQYSIFQHREIYEQLARRPYHWLTALAEVFSAELSLATNQVIAPEHILIDAPPVKREVEIDIDVFYANEKQYRKLANVSPVVQTLAKEQFDDYVKRIRIFAAPHLIDQLRPLTNLTQLLQKAIEAVPS